MENRKNNLMVFGCEEHETDEVNNDDKIITEMTQEACPEVNTTKVNLAQTK